MAHFPRCPPAPAHRSVLPASFGRQSGKARCSYPCAVTPTTFPIDALLPQARDTLDAHARLVLEAPPGAGKTTQVPLALLDAPWLAGRKIVMLEPRRVAARAAEIGRAHV